MASHVNHSGALSALHCDILSFWLRTSSGPLTILSELGFLFARPTCKHAISLNSAKTHSGKPLRNLEGWIESKSQRKERRTAIDGDKHHLCSEQRQIASTHRSRICQCCVPAKGLHPPKEQHSTTRNPLFGLSSLYFLSKPREAKVAHIPRFAED